MLSAHRYKIKAIGASSARYGNCEVCQKHVSDVYLQTHETSYRNPITGATGWQYAGDAFGHEACLMSIRITPPDNAPTAHQEALQMTFLP
jgi:hypothetical protein